MSVMTISSVSAAQQTSAAQASAPKTPPPAHHTSEAPKDSVHLSAEALKASGDADGDGH